ncbi:MAG: type II secretion system protein [Planctomycetota bacterium]|jgi:prepilin-type N-terminal cleavage/methylation domain-containing protein/prepilin-type processing-associated H-X9-DG protein
MSEKDNNGFTLIELLVVIAVIALLLSVILPALNNAKLAAKQLVCAAQMKQWTLASLAYTAENNYELTPFADTIDTTSGQIALNFETYYYNRLSPYLTEEYYGKWGMDDVRRCPMGKAGWGEKAVWIGIYYSKHSPERAPFVYLNSWDGSTLTKMTDPFKITSVKLPANYLMMLDARRDQVFEPLVRWPWDTDYDGDGMNDSRGGVIAAGLGPYNFARPKIHRGGCNVGLFDGHVEWISYKEFWEADSASLPVHQYWYNNNHP